MVNNEITTNLILKCSVPLNMYSQHQKLLYTKLRARAKETDIVVIYQCSLVVK